MTTPTETTTSLLEPAAAGVTPPAVEGKTTEVTPPAVAEGKTDTSLAGDKAPDAAAAAKTEADAKAPEKYAPFKLPEGQEVDTALLDEFTPTLKELKLDQEAAQKVINFAPRLVQATVEKTTAAILQQVGLADHAKWAAQVQNDKELGGEKFAENVAVAAKAAQTFASPALLAVLKQTGLGNHPEMVRLFHSIGKQISEDGFVPGGRSQAPKSLEERLYPIKAA